MGVRDAAPVKLVGYLFIFPGIFVVLVGPAGISMYRNMLSK